MTLPVLLQPGSFELLFEGSSDEGAGLPPAFRAIYGGDWRIPAGEDVYLYVNFCASRDGRVSFNEPGHLGGAEVAGFDVLDRWLMGLLRARADAILIGEGTVRADPRHVWTAAFVCPEDAEAFASLRGSEGRRAHPLQVVLSAEGALPLDGALLHRPGLETIVATTAAGARALRGVAGIEVLELGERAVEPRRLVETLGERYGVKTLLCEGGPRVYGSLLQGGVPLDEFLTISPLVLGEPAAGTERPSLVEGVGFAPGRAPTSRLLSVRRGGSYLYLRSRYGETAAR
ncbi:MAG TPA: dihydrofolate reductase family protein [Gaiellaceae bacterium]|jgi:riboflavin biosynthesis pyrimidine reductase|nr:dihydrofolate reductase family protein [Gaiellaceae bacterium]